MSKSKTRLLGFFLVDRAFNSIIPSPQTHLNASSMVVMSYDAWFRINSTGTSDDEVYRLRDSLLISVRCSLCIPAIKLRGVSISCWPSGRSTMLAVGDLLGTPSRQYTFPTKYWFILPARPEIFFRVKSSREVVDRLLS